MQRRCLACGNEVTNPIKAVRYCSKSCARKHAPRKRSGPTPTVRIAKTCPNCLIEFITRWEHQECCCRSCARALRAKRFGPGNWKGGVNRLNTGYLKELAKGHPAADKAGYVMQHRLVLEKSLGRYLGRDEHVHHKNGIRDDNRIENLELWSGRKDPLGQRTIDLAADMLNKLTENERNELFKRYLP